MTTDDLIHLLGNGLLLLAASFLLLTLFGFFEDRKQGGYRFRARRFLLTIAGLFTLNVLFLVFLVPIIGDVVKGAEAVGKTAVLKNRAISIYQAKNYSIMFPQVFDDVTRECYRAGLSNYVEDQWDSSFREAMWKREERFCQKNPSACNGKQQDYYEAARQYINPYHVLFRDFDVIGYFLGTDWTTAAVMYERIKRMQHAPDSKGNYQPPPDEKMLAEYRHYLTDCATVKPARWADPTADIVTSDTEFCVGACR